jgi:hypothetical protein
MMTVPAVGQRMNAAADTAAAVIISRHLDVVVLQGEHKLSTAGAATQIVGSPTPPQGSP